MLTFATIYALIYGVMRDKNLSQSWKDYFNQVADMLSEDALHYADVMEIARQGFVAGWSVKESAHQCEMEV